MTPQEYENVHHAIMTSAFGGAKKVSDHSVIVRVGFFSKIRFKAYLTGLRSAGLQIEWREPKAFFDQDWVIEGENAALKAVRKHCAR
jgi:hypothetical protein